MSLVSVVWKGIVWILTDMLAKSVGKYSVKRIVIRIIGGKRGRRSHTVIRNTDIISASYVRRVYTNVDCVTSSLPPSDPTPNLPLHNTRRAHTHNAYPDLIPLQTDCSALGLVSEHNLWDFSRYQKCKDFAQIRHIFRFSALLLPFERHLKSSFDSFQ